MKHIPSGPKKCNFLEVEKRAEVQNEKGDSWRKKHWIGAGEPSLKARPSAGRRFLTRVLIQMGEQLGEPEPHIFTWETVLRETSQKDCRHRKSLVHSLHRLIEGPKSSYQMMSNISWYLMSNQITQGLAFKALVGPRAFCSMYKISQEFRIWRTEVVLAKI